MATKPLGKGTSNLSVNLPHQALRDELESLAAKSGMKLGPYIRIVLANAAQKGARVAQRNMVYVERVLEGKKLADDFLAVSKMN